MEMVKTTGRGSLEEIHGGYGPKTLVSGWNYSGESYPKDLPEGEFYQALSSYKRLGTNDSPTPSHSSKHDEEEAVLSGLRPARMIAAARNMVTYPFLIGPPGKETMDSGDTRYLTTMQDSYRSYVERPPPPPIIGPEMFRPETKHRRLLTDPFNPMRPNLGTFLDENMEYLNDLRKPMSGPPPYGLHFQPAWTWDMK